MMKRSNDDDNDGVRFLGRGFWRAAADSFADPAPSLGILLFVSCIRVIRVVMVMVMVDVDIVDGQHIYRVIVVDQIGW